MVKNYRLTFFSGRWEKSKMKIDLSSSNYNKSVPTLEKTNCNVQKLTASSWSNFTSTALLSSNLLLILGLFSSCTLPNVLIILFNLLLDAWLSRREDLHPDRPPGVTSPQSTSTTWLRIQYCRWRTLHRCFLLLRINNNDNVNNGSRIKWPQRSRVWLSLMNSALQAFVLANERGGGDGGARVLE